MLTFILTIILISTTIIGFPYSEDIVHPSPKRLHILHTQRTFYNRSTIVKTDSGYLTAYLDYQWPISVDNYVTEYADDAHQVDAIDCQARLGCGYPQYRIGKQDDKLKYSV